jgi:hypothetical protein
MAYIYIFINKLILWLCSFRNSSGADDVHINATGMRHCLLPTIVFWCLFHPFLNFYLCALNLIENVIC